MALFHIQASHTPEECLVALDELVAIGPNEIDNWDIGCAVGDHSSHVTFRTLEAVDMNAARSKIPPTVRSKVELTEVGKLTAEQVRSFHQ